MLPLWAFLLAKLCALIWRRDLSWKAYFGVIAMSIGIHIAGDWITSYGTMLFAPLSDARYGLDVTFIIDLWFTGILVAGLLACWIWWRSPLPAIAGLAVLCGYIAFQGLQQHRAIEWGEAYAHSAGLKQAQITAEPRPVSPFNWLVIVRSGEEVRYSFVNLVRRETLTLGPDPGLLRRFDAIHLPRSQAQWVFGSRFGTSETDRAIARAAWSRPEFAFFRWFAKEPMLLRVDAGNPSACAWFEDLRFFTPGRPGWPFRFGMCRNADGGWRAYQLLGENTRQPVP